MAQYQITVNSEFWHHLFQKNTKDLKLAPLIAVYPENSNERVQVLDK